MDYLLIAIGFVLLVIGGEFLVKSSVGLSFKLKLSKMVIGLTVVSFATSAPELLVSIKAALGGNPDIASGNVIGSNIANIGLVLGLTAIILPMEFDRDFFRMNWPFMMLLSFLMYYFLWSDAVITFFEGFILIVLLLIFLFVLLRKSRGTSAIANSEVNEQLEQASYFKIIIWLLIGGSALFFGSKFLVNGSVNVAENLGISKRTIAVTMIAVGTSVPELAASIISALKGEKSISLGNLIGSNIFNIGSVIGVTAMIQPIRLESDLVLTNDMVWMISISALILPLALLPKFMVLSRYKGFLIFLSYIVFLLLLVVNKFNS
ncbi:calcium/sodium antiporter [Psychroflexus maritimus]|uniref:Calcium/sodium antiporter n=1 Tax=Psychroflexus maritimus TaxID=2714865 RepID=A0A967AAN5_9FLAO|nr:calcium/sodium antiporter [Psychroflexus maritimus]NGZ88737.1 calcium/sodium antiporter [Psychroflexus maritimus]